MSKKKGSTGNIPMQFILMFHQHLKEYEEENDITIPPRKKLAALKKAWREQLRRDKQADENYKRVAKELAGHRNGACKLIPIGG